MSYKIVKDGKGRGWYVILDKTKTSARGLYLNNLGQVTSPMPDILKITASDFKSIWFVSKESAEYVAEGYAAKLKEEQGVSASINGVLAILDSNYCEYLGVEENKRCDREKGA